MAQKFYAHPTNTYTWDNGAVGHRAGTGAFDTLGPYAKVRNCPIEGTDLRLTAYATGYADSFFSMPACTRHRGRHIRGFFTHENESVIFVPMKSHRHLLPMRSDTAV